jgi:hypothetical protein
MQLSMKDLYNATCAKESRQRTQTPTTYPGLMANEWQMESEQKSINPLSLV